MSELLLGAYILRTKVQEYIKGFLFIKQKIFVFCLIRNQWRQHFHLFLIILCVILMKINQNTLIQWRQVFFFGLFFA